jgi:hypothetical protein
LGQVVGTYTDAALVQHAFLRAPNGNIIGFDAPEAGGGQGQGTVAFAINSAGVIAGAFQDSNSVYHGFLRSPNGSFQQLDAPGAGTAAGQGTLAFSVNLPGTRTTGIYIDANNVQHGFVQTPPDRFEQFDPPASTRTNPTGITPGGAVPGFFIDLAGNIQGFVRAPNGAITTIDLSPHFTSAQGINAQGVIAGPFGRNGIIHGYVRSQNGSIVEFDDPAATFATVPLSINSAGAIAGLYADANDVFHGFERDAAGKFFHFDAPDGGTGRMQGTHTTTNNSSGEVTGYSVDDNNVARGFVWQP